MIHNDHLNPFDLNRVVTELQEARDVFGLDSVQFVMWDMTVLNADHAKNVIKPLMDEYGLTVNEFWCGFGKPHVYGDMYASSTLGLVPAAYRQQRMYDYFKGIEYAKILGTDLICTELGHTPINPLDEGYVGLVCTLKQIAEELEKHDAYLLEETARTPATILARLVEDVGSDRIGFNLDPANLTSSGNEATYAVDCLGPMIKAVHLKDSIHPVYPSRRGGAMFPLGSGDVNWPVIIQKLKDLDYAGALTLEYARPTTHGMYVSAAAHLNRLQPPISPEGRVEEMKASFEFINKVLDDVYK